MNNQRETIRYKKKNGKYNRFSNIKKECGETTYKAEIDKYLQLLDELGISMPNFAPEKQVKTYDEKGWYGINKEHLKMLKRRYYVGKQKQR